MRLLLTAGFDRALHVIALAELLHRQGNIITGILMVTPFSWKRFKSLSRQRGRGFLLSAGRRLLGYSKQMAEVNPLDTFLLKHNIRHRSIRAWAAERKVLYQVVPDLNSHSAIATLANADADGVIYGGGGILRQPFLQAAKGKVLNAHAGPLPKIRGMNALEWSLLLGLPPTVTIHVIDRGIDTGGILEMIAVPVELGDTIEGLRAKATVLGVEGLCRAVSRLQESLPPPSVMAESNRQCFVLAPVLRELLQVKLSQIAH